MKKLFVISLAAAIVVPASAQFDRLWDQEATKTGNPGLSNTEFTDQANARLSSYMVNDVRSQNGWIINRVGIRINPGANVAAEGKARLHIFQRVGNLPTGADNPANSTLVDYEVVGTGATRTLRTKGVLGFNPGAAADWWVGLTPQSNFEEFGQAFHIAAANTLGAAPSAWRNPTGAFGFGTDWVSTTSLDPEVVDATLLIEGVPEPATMAALGLGLAALAARRRRK